MTFGARAVKRQRRATRENLRQTNVGSTDAAAVLPTLSDTVDGTTGRSTPGPAEPAAPPSVPA